MRDEDKPPSAVATWSWFGWTVSIIIGAIIVLGGIGAAYWAFDTGTSGIRGKADVTRQNNDGTNQIAAQDAFNKLNGDIQTDLLNIKNDAKAAVGGDDFQKSVVQADLAQCAKDVHDYNADANDTTMKDWRPSNLPASFDDTICEVPK